MDPSGKAIFAAKSKRSGADGSIVSAIGGLTLLFDIRNSPVLNNLRQSHHSDELIVGFAQDPATFFYPHRTSPVRDEPAESKHIAGFRAKRRPVLNTMNPDRRKQIVCPARPARRGAKVAVLRPLRNGQTHARIAAHFAVSVDVLGMRISGTGVQEQLGFCRYVSGELILPQPDLS
jgi:hypothetical protein